MGGEEIERPGKGKKREKLSLGKAEKAAAPQQDKLQSRADTELQHRDLIWVN